MKIVLLAIAIVLVGSTARAERPRRGMPVVGKKTYPQDHSAVARPCKDGKCPLKKTSQQLK